MLNWCFVEFSEVSEEEHAQMLELHRQYIDADVETLPLASSDEVCMFRRGKGAAVEAFFVQSEHRVDVAGELLCLVELKSFYAHKSARGDLSLVLAALHSLLRMWWQSPSARRYALSEVSEASYRWYAKSLREVWSLRHPHLPERERALLEKARALLEQQLRERGDLDTYFDPERGTFVYVGSYVDAHAPAPDNATLELRRLLPDVKACESLLVVAELSLRNAWPGVIRAGRRMWRRLTKRLEAGASGSESESSRATAGGGGASR